MILKETDLEKAELIIASEAAFEKLSSIVEDYGDWILKTYFPIIDEIRKTLGDKIADKFASMTKEHLNSTFEKMNETKEIFLNATQTLEKIVKGEEVDIETEKPETKASDIELLTGSESEEENEESPAETGNRLEKLEEIRDRLNEIRRTFSYNELKETLSAFHSIPLHNLKHAEKKAIYEINSLINKIDNNLREMKMYKNTLREKWNVKGPVVDPEDIGKWKDYDIKDLCAMWKKLRKKENKTPEDKEKIAQIVFAIRAKYYGRGKKWGPAKKVCGIKESRLMEKWGKRVEIDRGEEGKWSPYTVYELCKKYKKLRKKKNKTPEDTETLRELAFAIRAKMGWPKGKGPLTICGIKIEH